MKVLRFLGKHRLNLVLALVLLFVQANCELTLPTLMSDIVDTGISGGGIDSVVPERISQDRLDALELFLTDDEAAELDAAFRPEGGALALTGTARERADIEGFLGTAEMLAYQLDQGVDAATFTQGLGAKGTEAALGAGDVTLSDIERLVEAGAIDRSQLVQVRDALVDKLGDTGESIVRARAVAFVKEAYTELGIDLDRVQTDYLLSEGAKMLAFAGLAAVCAVLAAFNASHTAASIARDLRHDLYERVLSFSPAETGRFSAASLITRATNDIQQIQMVLVMCMRMVLFAPCMGLGAIVRVVGYGDTGLQWIIAAAIVGISVVIGVLMGLTLPRFRIMQKLVDRNNLIAREIITGIMPVRAFGRSGYEEDRYDEANRALTGTYIFTNRAMSFMMPVMLIVMNLTSVAIVWFGGQGIDAGAMQVGDLMAYMNYTMQVIMSFMIITMIAVMLPRADVAAERIQEVLATRSSIEEPASPAPAPAGGWKGVLSFNDVSFAYPGADEPTIEHVSFTARPGQTVGIIGSTGVGKSTLVQLIPRLFDATEGSVAIDGVDVRRMGLKELRSLIGFAPQKGMLFSGDIAGNIKYGDPDLSDEAMVEAAAIAQARGFIEERPEGYESPVAQGGANVSGGQRQRLAIARALAGGRRILVFDDSFSALDYKTDAALRAALAKRAAQSTVVIVAQRIATIMHADEIIVLDDGRVAGQGTHEELLRACSAYREIAESQLSAKELGLTGEPASAASQAAALDAASEGGER